MQPSTWRSAVLAMLAWPESSRPRAPAGNPSAASRRVMSGATNASRDRGWRRAPPGRRHRTMSQHASRAGTSGAAPEALAFQSSGDAGRLLGDRITEEVEQARGAAREHRTDATRRGARVPSMTIWELGAGSSPKLPSPSGHGRRPPSVTAPQLGPPEPRALPPDCRGQGRSARRPRARIAPGTGKLSTSSTGRQDDHQPVSGPCGKCNHRDVDDGAIANVAGHAAVTAGDRRTVRSTQPGCWQTSRPLAAPRLPSGRSRQPSARALRPSLPRRGAVASIVGSPARLPRQRSLRPSSSGRWRELQAFISFAGVGGPTLRAAAPDCQHQRRTFAIAARNQPPSYAWRPGDCGLAGRDPAADIQWGVMVGVGRAARFGGNGPRGREG
jgi:hypothetical protein